MLYYICSSSSSSSSSSSTASEDEPDSYLHDVQLYKHRPEGNFPLKELHALCMRRVEVLMNVETIYTQTGIQRTAPQCKEQLIKQLQEHNNDLFVKIVSGASKELGHDVRNINKIIQLRKQDHISHFMLRRAFASYERRWFQLQELRLFYWRLSSLTFVEIKDFFYVNELESEYISGKDREELQEYIKATDLPNDTFFYKVPFAMVIDLVEQHKVFLRNGMAFVPETELFGLCFGYFKENLDIGLRFMLITPPEYNTDPRTSGIFEQIREYCAVLKTSIEEQDGPSYSELDEMSQTSYPLCMRMIHETLRKNHHLQHGSRIQYALFLKSIGVTMEDAVKLWYEEFTKKISPEVFEREYGYRLRHAYGQEGMRIDYQCFNCAHIISMNPHTSEPYGCPFKTLTNASLEEKLEEYKFARISVAWMTRFILLLNIFSEVKLNYNQYESIYI